MLTLCTMPPLRQEREHFPLFPLTLLLCLLLVSTSCAAAQPGSQSTPSPPSGLLHVEGNLIVNGNGVPVLLRGAQIESGLNYLKEWQSGRNLAEIENSATFQVMARDWHMNVLRLPLSNWIYAQDPTHYLDVLDRVVRSANAAGLYVVLDLHDDAQSGSPYGPGAAVAKAEDLPFWTAIATHYRENPMLLFDVFNEPNYADWQSWLHGGGSVGQGVRVIGMQDLVNAIRATGARQIVVVEPGGDRRHGWATIGDHRVQDANVMYSLHVYDGIVRSPQEQDAQWCSSRIKLRTQSHYFTCKKEFFGRNKVVDGKTSHV